jgi:hypothetical protein
MGTTVQQPWFESLFSAEVSLRRSTISPYDLSDICNSYSSSSTTYPFVLSFRSNLIITTYLSSPFRINIDQYLHMVHALCNRKHPFFVHLFDLRDVNSKKQIHFTDLVAYLRPIALAKAMACRRARNSSSISGCSTQAAHTDHIRPSAMAGYSEVQC